MRLLASLSIALIVAAAMPHGARAQNIDDTTDVHDVPLIEVPAKSDGNTLAILLSGDGGWASIDKDIAAELAKNGVSVVGVNLKSYLGKERTPDETTTDIVRVIRAYRMRWHRTRIVIVGFSRGANIAPFVVARAPDDIRSNLVLVALVGLAPAANFKWHLQDVFRDVKRDNDRPVRPELDRMKNVRTICVFGSDEKESECRDAPAEMTRVERPGGHHMDGDYKAVGDIVLNALKS
jgi:type IV secretory pathway VirJ component